MIRRTASGELPAARMRPAYGTKIKPEPSTWTSSSTVAFCPVGTNRPSSTFSQIVRPRTSPGLIVSEPSVAALRKLAANPRAGVTDAIALTRSSTVRMKLSPCSRTEPEKICALFGPELGRPQEAAKPRVTTMATPFARRNVRVFTAWSPRPIIILPRWSTFWRGPLYLEIG